MISLDSPRIPPYLISYSIQNPLFPIGGIALHNEGQVDLSPWSGRDAKKNIHPKKHIKFKSLDVVQTFGLLVFTWMGLTGGLMFFLLVPGQEARGVVHAIQEIHEIGEGLIPVFLVLHVGAVILHALSGRHLWRKMIFLKE